MHSADANLSDYGDVADFREIAAQGLARGRRELNENTATVMRVRAPNKKALLGHRLQPAQRGRRWYGRGDAQAGNGYPKLRDLGLQEIEQHIPRGVGEQLFGEEAAAEASGADDGPHGLGRKVGKVAEPRPNLHSVRRSGTGGKARESRGDPADLIAKLAQSSGIAIGGDIRDPLAPSSDGRRQGERRNPLTFGRIDEN